jgi:hypothetical protein
VSCERSLSALFAEVEREWCVLKLRDYLLCHREHVVTEVRTEAPLMTSEAICFGGLGL